MGGRGCIWRPSWPKMAAAHPLQNALKRPFARFGPCMGAMAKGADQESGLTDQAKGAKAARAKRKDARAQREATRRVQRSNATGGKEEGREGTA